MRSFLLTLALLLVVVGVVPASAGTISRGTVASAVLGRDFPYLVYLPDDYQPDGIARYPVLYLLHGASVDETSWTE
ncbi:alpha/beta hydrolase-fold protein, partial [Staphylococcus aureus]